MNEIHGEGWWLGLPAYFVLGPERLVGNVILIGILAIAFQRQPMPVQFILRASRPRRLAITLTYQDNSKPTHGTGPSMPGQTPPAFRRHADRVRLRVTVFLKCRTPQLRRSDQSAQGQDV